MAWTEQEYADYLRRRGFPLDPTLTTRHPSNTLDAQAPEGVLLAKVRRLAQAHSWLTYHVFDARKSEEGYPDLTLVRPASSTSPGRLLFAELKSARGQLTKEQHRWLDVLRHSLPGVEVYCWRPSDWERIVQVLTQPREAP
jgi:hypothetical protein